MARPYDWLTNKLRFSKGYGAATLLVLAIEVVIALFVRDTFVRPYVGDTLSVVLLYGAVLTVLELPRAKVAIGSLAVALLIELGQGLGLLELLGLAEVTAARVILGTYCDPHDCVAYAAALPLIALADPSVRCGSLAQRAFRSLLRFSQARRPRLGKRRAAQ